MLYGPPGAVLSFCAKVVSVGHLHAAGVITPETPMPPAAVRQQLPVSHDVTGHFGLQPAIRRAQSTRISSTSFKFIFSSIILAYINVLTP